MRLKRGINHLLDFVALPESGWDVSIFKDAVHEQSRTHRATFKELAEVQARLFIELLINAFLSTVQVHRHVLRLRKPINAERPFTAIHPEGWRYPRLNPMCDIAHLDLRVYPIGMFEDNGCRVICRTK